MDIPADDPPLSRAGSGWEGKPVTMRQASGISCDRCSICKNGDQLVGKNEVLDMRLGCSCLFHFHCLVHFIKAALGDKETLVRNSDGLGIVCPNYVADICSATPEKYFLSPNELQFLKDHHEKKLQGQEVVQRFEESMGEDRLPEVTETEITKLETWLSEERDRRKVVKEDGDKTTSVDAVPTQKAGGGAGESSVVTASEDPFMALIIATSKECPNPGCSNRETHFHGHGK